MSSVTAEIQIDQIVREVMRRLSSAAHQSSTSVQPTPNVDKPKQSDSVLRMDCRLITLEKLRDRTQGVKQIVVSEKAIVTPAVCDWLRDENIQLSRGLSESANQPVRVICGSDAASQNLNWIESIAGSGQVITLPVAGTEVLLQAVVKELSNTNAVAILLTAEPHRVSCEANRHPALRASFACCACCVDSAITSLNPNVAVLDVKQSRADQEKIVRRYLKQ